MIASVVVVASRREGERKKKRRRKKEEGRRKTSQLCEVSKGAKWWKGMIVRLSDCNDCKSC
jgi:hypothetical protein